MKMARRPEERVPCLKAHERLVKTANGNNSFLEQAKSLMFDGNIMQAHYMYVKYFESFKDISKCKESTILEFVTLVTQISVILVDCDQFENLMKIYLQALQFFPNNYVIMNEMGSYLYRSGQGTIGKKYVEKALKTCPEFLPAQRNLTYLKWNEFPRWQFSMMNTLSRNRAYFDAINNAIKKGYRNILDIGSGCGLLSLMASQNPKVNVVAVEENKTLCDISKKLFQDYERKNVTVIEDNSNNLEKIPGGANLLVTEIFDAAVFGEYALKTLIHANKVLLDENSITIPLGASVFATGIFCNESLSKYRLVNKIPELGIEKMCIRIREEEPYDTVHLNTTHTILLTDTKTILDVNFSDVALLEKLVSNEWFTAIELQGTTDGLLTHIAVWFELNLDENIKISSTPESAEKCWEQAIFNLKHPFYIKKGQKVKVKVFMKNNHFIFKLQNSFKYNHQCFTVSKEIVSFLGDAELVNKIIQMVNHFSGDKKLYTVCDSTAFPLFGMLMAKKGSYFYGVLPHQDDYKFFEHILEINKISPKTYSILEAANFSTFLQAINSSDLIFNEVIADGGFLRRFETKHLTITKWVPIILPQKIQLCFKLIESDYLDFHNKIDDHNVMDFKISQYLKEFTGDEHPFLTHFEHFSLSEVQVFDELLYLHKEEIKTTSVNVKVTRDGRVNGVLYWFNLIMVDGIEFNTMDSTHFSKSCFIEEMPRNVKSGETIPVTIHQYQNHLKIYL